MKLARITNVCLGGLVLCASAHAAPASLVSSSGDTKATALTVYSAGRGLVTVKRELSLPSGELELRFMDVAAKIMPETVAIEGGRSLEVLEQNYEFDLLSPEKLLQKYVGKEAQLTFQKLKENSTSEEVKSATLLSANAGTVWQIDGAIVVNPAYSRLSFPELPANLIAKPTLVWLLKSDSARKQTVEASYLTNGISWKADYVLSLDAGGKQGDLQGWVTINNQSGAAYEDARLQLIAGDVNIATPQATRALAAKMAIAESAAPAFQEKSFFEYHLYTLERPATVRDNQQKQISLLEGKSVAIEREYKATGEQWYFMQRLGEQKQKVAVLVKLDNSAANKLGIPLPKGIVRVYQADSDGSKQFVGEDSIDHTPRDEELELKLGDAFDVVAERKQTDYDALGTNTHESAFEVSIRNHKDEDIVVRVEEPIGGDWDMKEHSHEFDKTSAFSAEFKVPVPKRGEAKLTYRVRVRY